jgi:hypothetical protein
LCELLHLAAVDWGRGVPSYRSLLLETAQPEMMWSLLSVLRTCPAVVSTSDDELSHLDKLNHAFFIFFLYLHDLNHALRIF